MGEFMCLLIQNEFVTSLRFENGETRTRRVELNEEE